MWPLDRLSDEDRTWWQSWTYPTFAQHLGEQLNVEEAREKLEQLRTAYPELKTPPDAPDATFKLVGRVWADTNFDLDQLLSAESPIIALNETRFQELARKSVGKDHVQMVHELDGYATLS